MKIIVTESQLKLLSSHLLKESDSVNEYGFTKEEMKKIVNSVKKEVSEYYKGLKDRVKTLEVETERMKNISLKHLSVENQETIFKGYIEPKLNQYEKDKKYLETFDFEERVKKGIEWDLGGGAYTMSYKIRYDKWVKESLNRSLTKEDIIDLFVTSLEGGSNYWYYMDLPENIKTYGNSTSESVGNYILQGGSVQFYDIEEYNNVLIDKENGEYTIKGDVIDEKSFTEDLEDTKLGIVDLDKILEAITLIKKEYPNIWENILLENADAGDADVFLQLCVMGEVVYG
jgi:hypothetical protein